MAAAGLVLTRAEGKSQSLVFVLVVVLVVRLIITVDARVLIVSLIDGAGLYLIVNVLGLVAGLRSPGASDRLRASLEFGGFVRTIFPFSWGLDSVPAVASVYVAAATFLLLRSRGLLMLFRVTSFGSAGIVLVLGASRTSISIAVLIPLILLVFPITSRWLAQALTAVASVSALLLPGFSSTIGTVVAPFLSLIPGRSTNAIELTTLTYRDYIWHNSIQYWLDHVEGMQDRLLGFGQNGQIGSGAWAVYGRAIAVTVRHPERATMHNAYLQQLFDGGLIGWALLTVCVFWTALRLSRRRACWGAAAVGSIAALCALLMNSITQVSIAPGVSQESFWILMVLVGVACQTPTSNGPDEEDAGRDSATGLAEPGLRPRPS